MHRKLFIAFVVFGAVSGVFCDGKIEKKEKLNETSEARGFDRGIHELMGCIDLRNTRCFIDVANDMVQREKKSLLAEAERSMVQKGRAEDDEETPTEISETIGELVTELTNVVKSGISGFFRDGKDDEEEEEEEETNQDVAEEEEEGGDDDDKKDADESRQVRKKKKKKIHKLIALIKLLILGAVLAVKLIILLKVLAFHLQVKFLLIAFAGLVLNAARFYLDLKKGHQPQKVIYYEHAQHQHHYEGGEDEWSSGPSEGGYWGRSYEEDDGKTAQDIAYAKQKPSGYSYENSQEKQSGSWWG